MLRKHVRKNREYLYRKKKEEDNHKIESKKRKIEDTIERNLRINGELWKNSFSLQENDQWQDECRWAGVEDPKIVVTTSQNPKFRLKMFAKELKLILPNAQKINRGNHDLVELIETCRANHVTDFIMVQENRGVPGTLVISHLPYGPTALFTISEVVMRHDIQDIGTILEQYPHVVFHNFKTELAQRTMRILRYLFPVPKKESNRVVTLANHDDYVVFRHHMFKKLDGQKIQLSEIGPRFTLKLFEIKSGTLDTIESVNSEWSLRPYTNTSHKRRLLSHDNGWED